MRTLAERIRHLRRISCLKGQEFADLIGVSKAYISQLEKGKRTNLNDDKISLLSSHFSVNSEWIKDGIGPSPVNFSSPAPPPQPPPIAPEGTPLKNITILGKGSGKGDRDARILAAIETIQKQLDELRRELKGK